MLKIFQSGEDPRVLECQDEVMERLAAAGLPYRFPRVRPTLSEGRMGEVAAGGVRHLVRLVEWVPGLPLALSDPRSPELELEVGRLLGGMDRVLREYDHPAADRRFAWDLRRAGEVVDRHITHVDEGRSPRRTDLIWRFRELFRSRVEPRANRLPASVIHGDANDYNLLVIPGATGKQPGRSGTGRFGRPPPGVRPRLTGLVDFGDLVRSWRVAEPAVAAAYTLLDRDDPLGTAVRVARGYHEELPLTEEEIGVFFPLTAMRLCVSVVHSARRAKERPDDPYVRISEAPAWRALERLDRIDPDEAEGAVREACGRGALPPGEG